MRQMMIINMVLTLKAVKGVLLIKSILKIIELQKKLFVKDIELG